MYIYIGSSAGGEQEEEEGEEAAAAAAAAEATRQAQKRAPACIETTNPHDQMLGAA